MRWSRVTARLTDPNALCRVDRQHMYMYHLLQKQRTVNYNWDAICAFTMPLDAMPVASMIKILFSADDMQMSDVPCSIYHRS